jgi:hypothetical protein
MEESGAISGSVQVIMDPEPRGPKTYPYGSDGFALQLCVFFSFRRIAQHQQTVQLAASLEIRKNFFSSRVTESWNKIPSHVKMLKQ